MAEFKAFIQEQGMLFPPYLGDLIPDNHLVRVVSEIVDRLDLSDIINKYVYQGAEAYHPKMLIKILFYGYATGTVSSRRIGEKLAEDITFMWLAGMQKPDFRTISDFRKRHRPIVESLFIQILVLAAHMGLVNLGHVSLDGSKIKANASKYKAMSRGRLQKNIGKLEKEIKELLDLAEQTDQKEDDEEKPNQNTLPSDLSSKKERLEKLEQALKDLNEQKPVEKAKNSKVANNQQINFTDKESCIMQSQHLGVHQAYNAQIAVDEQNGFVVGATLTNNPFDQEQLIPLMKHVEKTNGKLPDQITADTGYFTAENINFCLEQNLDAYIAPPKDQKSKKTSFNKNNFTYDSQNDQYICPEDKKLEYAVTKTRNPGVKERVYQGIDCLNCPSKSKCVKAASGYRRVQRVSTDPVKDAMTTKVQSEEGQKIYSKRKGIVEPVWGQIKHIQGFRQFSFRGLEANTAELFLVAIGHNLRKLFFSIIARKKEGLLCN